MAGSPETVGHTANTEDDILHQVWPNRRHHRAVLHLGCASSTTEEVDVVTR
jgi:hypothetical protein